MPKLYRQLLRETYGVFFATLLILLTIILSFRLAGLLNSASQGNIALGAISQLLGLQALRFLVLLAPVAFILGAMMTLGRWHRDLEITALLAGGIGYGQQLKALLMGGLPLGLFLLYLQLFILPWVYQQQELIQKQAQQEASLLLFQPNSFRTLPDGSVVYTEEIEGHRLKEFFLLRQDKKEKSLITADAGEFTLSPNAKIFTLFGGKRLAWTGDFEKINEAQFKKAEIILPMPEQISSNRLRNIPTAELNHSPQHLGELWTRINPSLALCIFIGILPLLARGAIRGGRYQKVLPAFLLFALYINLLDFLVSQIKKERLPILTHFYLHFGVLFFIFIYWQLSTRKPPYA